MIGCSNSEVKTESENPSVTTKFRAYLNEALQSEIGDEEHFYLFTTEKICELCIDSHFTSFDESKEKLKSEKLTIISDFPCEKRFEGDLFQICQYDSLGLFNNYSFPKSYLTLYKTKNGKVDSYVFYKESEKFEVFMQENNLW